MSGSAWKDKQVECVFACGAVVDVCVCVCARVWFVALWDLLNIR